MPVDERVPPATAAPEVVSLRGGAVGYLNRPVLHDVDFSVRSGEVVVLLGANGSGKSTLVRGLLGLVPLMSGRLELFGVPAARFHQRWRIGYVPQRHTVVAGVPSTVREVVTSGRLARKRPFAPLRAADRAAVESSIATVGLEEKTHTSVAQLSGGQQRRVLIARALAAEPDMLVMDEPTAGVDLVNQEILAETLQRLVTTGKTLLLVAHELGPLEPLIDRVVVLRDGMTTYDGPPSSGIPGTDDQHAHHGEPPPDVPAPGGIELTGR
ncbi:MAG: metal ABC transporter ATP-binding protein [Actinomycetes bacterium]